MKAFHRSLNPIVDLAGVIISLYSPPDRDIHKGDLDKGSCTRNRKASLKSGCDSQGAAARVGFSLLRRDARVGGSCPFQRSVPQSRATTHKLLFRCILSSALNPTLNTPRHMHTAVIVHLARPLALGDHLTQIRPHFSQRQIGLMRGGCCPTTV